jgi:hypothetical protein
MWTLGEDSCTLLVGSLPASGCVVWSTGPGGRRRTASRRRPTTGVCQPRWDPAGRAMIFLLSVPIEAELYHGTAPDAHSKFVQPLFSQLSQTRQRESKALLRQAPGRPPGGGVTGLSAHDTAEPPERRGECSDFRRLLPAGQRCFLRPLDSVVGRRRQLRRHRTDATHHGALQRAVKAAQAPRRAAGKSSPGAVAYRHDAPARGAGASYCQRYQAGLPLWLGRVIVRLRKRAGWLPVQVNTLEAGPATVRIPGRKRLLKFAATVSRFKSQSTCR